MPVQGMQQYKYTVYTDMDTSNQSFRDIHYYLKDKGIKNNAFFLCIIDRDLIGVDPRDPRLNRRMKAKILNECVHNYWYFIREVVRIPDQGGAVGSGAQYKLTRGNLAMNFGFVRNWNMFVEFPRQNFKTVSALVRYLWTFNFGTRNSEIMFINKKHEDSKMNLARFKELRESLPDYLRMDTGFGIDGKKTKPKNTVESLEHPSNKNNIRTMPAARNKVAANSLGRGCTQPIQWYDEYAFIPYVGTIYQSATPAFKTAAMNAHANKAPYGILITTTPGDLTTEEGLEAFETKELATRFSETFYDMQANQLHDLLERNTNSNFVYIRYTYQQLGRNEQWFKEICIDMKKNWSAIRREVLLEWSKASDNSPFKKEDLNIVKGLIREPIRTITLANYYQMNIYADMNLRFPPIIGVDVSGGYKRDSSAITIIDSLTTNVVATLNCNYISTDDLAKCVYELITKYLPNAVVNIERNGGYGASVISKLKDTVIRRNLYYEIKDKVIEERVDAGGNIVRKKQRTKVYGLDSSKNIRETLMEILRERMENHKDKFIAPIILSELEGLEVKRNGKIEHSSQTHDDQLFSYLMALYVWYEGMDVMERYGIRKKSIKTDSAFEEGIEHLDSRFTTNIAVEMETIDNEQVQRQLNQLKDKSVLYDQFTEKQHAEDNAALAKLLATPLGKKTYQEKYHINMDEMDSGITEIPSAVFDDFYND